MSTWTAFWFLFFVTWIARRYPEQNHAQRVEMLRAFREGSGLWWVITYAIGHAIITAVGAYGACHFGIQLWEQAHVH